MRALWEPSGQSGAFSRCSGLFGGTDNLDDEFGLTFIFLIIENIQQARILQLLSSSKYHKLTAPDVLTIYGLPTHDEIRAKWC